MTDLLAKEGDAQKIQNLISDYTKRHTGADLPYIDIVKAFKKFSPHGNHGSRIFAALVDLKLNFALLLLDSFYSRIVYHQQQYL
jgi:hypothetical protein